MKNLTIILLAIFLATPTIKAQTNHFEDSYNELKAMLEGGKVVDFERAVYLSEAPYWDNSFTYDEFQWRLKAHQIRVEMLIEANNNENGIDFSVKTNSKGV